MNHLSKLLISASILFTSCSPMLVGNTYTYKYQKEDNSKDLTWNSDMLDVKFDITDEQVQFKIKNKTAEPVKVLWDDASIVTFGEANKVTHKGINYTNRSFPQPNTTIPPGATLDDLVVPVNNVDYKEGVYTKTMSMPGGWQTKPLYATNDFGKASFRKLIEDNKGQKMVLYLPIQDTQNKVHWNAYTFVVSDVVCISCANKRIPGRAPARKPTSSSKGSTGR
jgi:hypothetical protein